MSCGLTCQTCDLGHRLNQVKQLFSLKFIINLYILKKQKKDQKRAQARGWAFKSNPARLTFFLFYFSKGWTIFFWKKNMQATRRLRTQIPATTVVPEKSGQRLFCHKNLNIKSFQPKNTSLTPPWNNHKSIHQLKTLKKLIQKLAIKPS